MYRQEYQLQTKQVKKWAIIEDIFVNLNVYCHGSIKTNILDHRAESTDDCP